MFTFLNLFFFISSSSNVFNMLGRFVHLVGECWQMLANVGTCWNVLSSLHNIFELDQKCWPTFANTSFISFIKLSKLPAFALSLQNTKYK